MAGYDIFVSYRRSDAPHAAARLAMELSRHLATGKVFCDVNALSIGDNFEAVIRERLSSAIMCVAVIGGRKWFGMRRGQQPRLFDQDDWVRAEIRQAFETGIPVVPVLVDEATMPKRHLLPYDMQRLASQQAIRLRHESFSHDAYGLAKTFIDMRPRFVQQIAAARHASGHGTIVALTFSRPPAVAEVGLHPASPPPQNFAGCSDEDVIELMMDWFAENFEDPAARCPHVSEEGGYLYLHGGPYLVRDELENAFSGIVAEDLIEEAADQIEAEGGEEWAPSSRRIYAEDALDDED